MIVRKFSIELTIQSRLLSFSLAFFLSPRVSQALEEQKIGEGEMGIDA
jgi:hypothetical protein